MFGAVGTMKARLLEGKPADVVILSRTLVDELARDGHVIETSSVRDIGIVQTAIAVRRGDRLPSIGDQGELRSALDAADEIHFPDPEQATAGIHFAKVMKALGIVADDRLRPAPNGATAMRALAASMSHRPSAARRRPRSCPHRALCSWRPCHRDAIWRRPIPAPSPP